MAVKTNPERTPTDSQLYGLGPYIISQQLARLSGPRKFVAASLTESVRYDLCLQLKILLSMDNDDNKDDHQWTTGNDLNLEHVRLIATGGFGTAVHEVRLLPGFTNKRSCDVQRINRFHL